MESPPEVTADSFSAGTREGVKDPSLEQKLRQVADEHGILPHHLKRLFLYCSLFPFGYEFRKDELVQLWIAEGFIRERHGERMEDIAGEHFNSLEKNVFFVFSRCDFTMDFDSVLSDPTDNPSNFLYKVNPSKHSLLEDTISSGNYFKAVDGKVDGASEMTRHLSLIGEDIDGMAFGILQNFKHLRTLHMLSCRGSSMKHVPRDLCFTLTFLKTLNLSGTLISELPSSIGNVKSLRYVDASHTPISRLPESIDSLYNLQTIKLRGCFHFVQLPKGMKKLKKLRHIDLDIIRQLDSMPAHLGSLSNLQTLPAFLVGRDDGCRVGELKNLNDLKGSFNISRLENVLSEEEAEEAALIEKKCIHRLELRWSDMFVEYSQQEKILECLQPHSGLKELQIQQYSGSILPTWIGNPFFTDLVVITLYRCRNCKLLPCMGQLPALKSLSIIEVNEVKEINHQFFRKGLADHAFPKLERLEVDIMLSLKQWKDVQVGDLPSLVKLTLDSCPELVTLPALLCLKSLKHLELRCCPKLMALPTGGLPTSLQFFLLLDCLELKIWCLKTEHWSMLCHVPSIWFDHEEIKGRCGMTEQLALARVGAVAAEARTYTRISTEYSSPLSAAPAPSLPQLPAFNSRTMEPQDMPSKVLHSVVSMLLYGSKPLYSALPANEIPEWFSTKSTSTPISIPTGDNKWKGVATCAVFSVQGHTPADLDFSNYSYLIILETDVASLEPYVINWEEQLRPLGSSSDLLLISYEPSLKFPKGALNQSTVVRAIFETNNPYMVVRKCGIRLVYEQDAGWFSINICPGVESIYLNKDDDDAVLESGWLSQVDKCLKWEKFIPPLEEDSTFGMRMNIQSVLPRYLEALNHCSTVYKFNITGSPAWFKHLFRFIDKLPAICWASWPINIPQNLNKSKKWMGFAIYASIAEELGHIIEDKDGKYRVYFRFDLGCKCHTTVSQELQQVKSSEKHDQLLVVYIPRAQIADVLLTQTSTNAMHISFRIDSPCVKFQSCGFRIVYQEDIQGFAETIIRCMQREDALEFHDKLVVENWIELIRCNPKERDSRTRRQKEFELLSQKHRSLADLSNPGIMKKIVPKLDLYDEKSKKKAMRAVSGLEVAMEVNGKSVVAAPANVIFLSTILGRDGSMSVHKCDWKCQNEHVCGNMYRCKVTGLTHICDKNCNQRILYDNHSSLCRASGQVFPLTPVEEQAVRGVRKKIESEAPAAADNCSFKSRQDAQLHPSLLPASSAAKLEMAWT